MEINIYHIMLFITSINHYFIIHVHDKEEEDGSKYPVAYMLCNIRSILPIAWVILL